MESPRKVLKWRLSVCVRLMISQTTLTQVTLLILSLCSNHTRKMKSYSGTAILTSHQPKKLKLRLKNTRTLATLPCNKTNLSKLSLNIVRLLSVTTVTQCTIVTEPLVIIN
uniref:Uncharacterized protein n=1 Tax=Cacopsylla melanoneura TaxID=428564 RepID=A0A8D8V3Y7_9HEMI